MTDNNSWLTIPEAAEYLGIKIPTIRKYLKLGKLPHSRHGKIIRFKRQGLDSFLDTVIGYNPAGSALGDYWLKHQHDKDA